MMLRDIMRFSKSKKSNKLGIDGNELYISDLLIVKRYY